MDGFQLFWSMIPGADETAKLRFLVVAASGAGVAWGLVRWLRKEDLGTTAKTILKTQASAESQAAAERMELRELVLMLSSRVEARLAALPGEAGMGLKGAMGAIMQDLKAAVERLAAGGHEDALLKLQAGECGPAMAVFARMRSAALKKRAAEKEEAALARQQGALALLTDEDEAMRHYALACALDPDDAEGWNRLGALKLRAGDGDGAHRCYNQAMALGESAGDRPAAGEAMSHLGLLLSREGERAEACAKWKNALELFRQIGMEAQIAQVETWMREAGCPD